MCSDDGHLLLVQPSGLQQNAVGICDFSDVMEGRGKIDVAAKSRRQPELLGNDAAVFGDPKRVCVSCDLHDPNPRRRLVSIGGHKTP
jgi:hypothetical protein